MQDQIVKFGRNMIQHGQLNNRVYIMKVIPGNELMALQMAEFLAEQHRYTKIFAKLPASSATWFIDQGYVEEARIKTPDRQESELVFVSRFLDERRAETKNRENIDSILELALAKGKDKNKRLELPGDTIITEAELGDANQMAELYSSVFKTYPFPIHSPAFLRTEMDRDTRYFLMRKNGRLIGASSAEQDFFTHSVEMTDFAVLPEFRGQRLAENLLRHMERELVESPMQLGFTIARAISYGMNITFARLGYEFGGTLVNNTNISGSIESMNIWYKPFPKLKTEGSDHAIANTHK